MRKVYHSENSVDAHLVRDRLAGEGIEAVVHGDLLAGAIGELPVDSTPTVWVVEDADEARARALIERWESLARGGSNRWVCARCGEEHDASFECCWRCGADAPRP